jgi:lipopolysaccharide/colanic/teichoic acid biosynthesis glycosyltransferase
MKRLFDIIASFLGLLLMSPILLVFMYLVYRQDKHSPFYMATRVGKNGTIFRMVKLRSMSVNADKSGVDSTSLNDTRITAIGHKIRKYKLDEFTQLWNVFLGDMSLVGPRPNVKRETDLYSSAENGLLTVRPGITDFSSIVFSDEGDILEGKSDPDIAYNQLIRPWKSRLGLVYVDNISLWLDIELIFYTVIAIISKQKAVDWVVRKLSAWGIDSKVVDVCKRESKLQPFPPPGMDEVVVTRSIMK